MAQGVLVQFAALNLSHSTVGQTFYARQEAVEVAFGTKAQEQVAALGVAEGAVGLCLKAKGKVLRGETSVGLLEEDVTYEAFRSKTLQVVGGMESNVELSARRQRVGGQAEAQEVDVAEVRLKASRDGVFEAGDERAVAHNINIVCFEVGGEVLAVDLRCQLDG